ncbi:MAG: ThuA domain-containing protein [Treponema sp.]
MITVTIYNEFVHEQEIDSIRKIYPQGIHGCIKSFLSSDENLQIQTATFEMKEHGLTEEVLSKTDVLIFWSHARQEEFSDEVATRVQKHVLQGMGLITLHSAHYSKVMRRILGTSMTLSWRDNDRERLFCCNPSHPIAKDVPIKIEIPHEEMYSEYFDIPKPDEVIFIGWFSGGEAFRSGCTFTREKGRIFYFQPGHEAYPIYYMTEIQKIIHNAVYWCSHNEAILGSSKNILRKNIHAEVPAEVSLSLSTKENLK